MSVSVGSGPSRCKPFGQAALDRRADDRPLLVAEQASLAAVRIKRADADPRPDLLARWLAAPRLGPGRIRRDMNWSANRALARIDSSVNSSKTFLQRRVQGDVDHGQAGRRQHLVIGAQVEHHGEVVDAAQFGQQLGMARIMVPRTVQRLFLQGRGGDRHRPGRPAPAAWP